MRHLRMVSLLTPKRRASTPEGPVERAIPARTMGVVQALGCGSGAWLNCLPAPPLQALEAVGVVYDDQADRIPTMFRDQTTWR